MTGGIKGINRSSLWNAWKLVRKQLAKASFRDVVDYLEYDIDPETWIRSLLREIAEGAYEPNTPVRYPLAKSKGFSRRMTLPQVRDLVLYRAIVDYLYARMKRREHRHVYFERGRLAKVSKEAAASARGRRRRQPPMGRRLSDGSSRGFITTSTGNASFLKRFTHTL